MKKITFLLLLVFSFLGGVSSYAQDDSGLPDLTTDESHPVYYLIKNLRSTKYAMYTGDYRTMSQVSDKSIAGLFYFTGESNDGVMKVKIHNAVTTKQLDNVGDGLWKEGGRDWYIKAFTKDKYTGYAISADNSFGYNSWNDLNQSSLCYYYAADAGSIWSFEKLADSDVASIYESTKTTAQTLLTKYADHKDGLFLPTTEQYSALQALSTAETPANNVEKIKAAAEFFVSSKNFYKLPENGKTYLIKNFERDNKAYMGFAVENAFTPDYILKARSVGSDKDCKSACWTIEELNGRYKFKNVATGLYMGKTPNVNDYPYHLVNASEAEAFNLYPNDGDRLGTAAIGFDGYNKWHMAGGKDIVRWETSTCSSWYFEEVSIEDLSAKTEPVSVAAEIANIGKVLASIFAVEDAAYQSALAAYESNKTYETARALTASLKGISNKLWRIRSVCRNLAISSGGNLPEADREAKAAYLASNYSGDVGVRCNSFNNDMPEAIWQFVSNENGYYIYNVNTGKYIGKTNASANSKYLSMVEKKDAGLYQLANAGEGTQATFLCRNAGGGAHKYLHVSGYGLMNYTPNPMKNSASAFFITPAVELEVALHAAGDASYATTYLPFSVSAAEGAELYTGELDGNVMKLTKSHTGVAAEQGIVLVGESSATKAVLTIGEGKATGNGLEGTLTPKAVEAKSVLTLGMSDSKVGFFAFTGTQIGANKAYVEKTAGASAVMINFGEVTGIENAVAPEAANAPLYDLSGRRVVKAVKGGLYIQNGKKFIAR